MLRLALAFTLIVGFPHAATGGEWLSKQIPVADVLAVKVKGKDMQVTHKHLPKNYYGRYEQSGGKWGWYFVLRQDGTGETAIQVPNAMGEYTYDGAEVKQFEWGVAVVDGKFARTTHERAWYGDRREFEALQMIAWNREGILVRALHEAVRPDGRPAIVLGACSKAL